MKRIPTLLMAAALSGFVAASASLSAQIAANQEQPAPRTLSEWRALHGDAWTVRTSRTTGAVRFLFGGAAEPPFRPVTDWEYEEAARHFFAQAHELMRIDDRSLSLRKVVTLPLSRAGSTDKVAVTFDQFVDGVPVAGGGASALFGPDGVLLALDTTGLPDLADFATTPAIGAYAAVSAASGAFRGLTGWQARDIAEPELVIYPHLEGSTLEPRLAWAVELRVAAEVTGGLPQGRRVYVAADGRGGILGEDQLIHNQDLTGNVETWASPGTLPDMTSNPETLHVTRRLLVSSPAGDVNTDDNGNFTIPVGSGAPVNVTFVFKGPLVRVQNQAGSDYSLTQSITPGSPANVDLNPARTEYDTAHANAFIHVMRFNEWVHQVISGDTTMDFKVKAKVNINSSCNAYYNGSSINFFRKAGSCNNTAYSTVIAHEEGHWANNKYASGNGGDGFGEGNADNFAMYIYDNPVVGEFFTTGGGYVRTGNNTRQFCGDANPACYGEVHADGEVLMGAFWKMRENLNSSLGDAAGDLVANTLFLSWMNSFDDSQIRSIIEEHLLVLDDDDGDYFNGTPNFQEINDGFVAQGFPGVELDVISVSHDELGNTLDETGPYTVGIQAEAVDGNFVTVANMIYQVDGVNPVTLPMTPLGGGSYTADIPGQPASSSIQYWIELEDDLGNTDKAPRAGDRWGFVIGAETTFFQSSMTPGAGFTHGAIQGVSDWESGYPAGDSGTAGGGWSDPDAPWYGGYCWGTDLGNGSNGSYEGNVHTWLESPVIDATDQLGVHLRFRRWLTVDRSTNDVARILVNGVEKWRNPTSAALIDEDWMEIELNISDQADDNPALVVRFELQTNGSAQLGGWNLDDFKLVSVRPPGSLYLAGPLDATGGTHAGYQLSGVDPSATIYLLSSAGNGGTMIKNHLFQISRPFRIEGGPVHPEPDGTYNFPVVFPYNWPTGPRYFQAASGGAGLPVSDSNLWVTDVF